MAQTRTEARTARNASQAIRIEEIIIAGQTIQYAAAILHISKSKAYKLINTHSPHLIGHHSSKLLDRERWDEDNPPDTLPDLTDDERLEARTSRDLYCGRRVDQVERYEVHEVRKRGTND